MPPEPLRHKLQRWFSPPKILGMAALATLIIALDQQSKRLYHLFIILLLTSAAVKLWMHRTTIKTGWEVVQQASDNLVQQKFHRK